MFEESGNPGTQEEVVNEQSAVQHVDSSPYAFVHIVGPMAATSVTWKVLQTRQTTADSRAAADTLYVSQKIFGLVFVSWCKKGLISPNFVILLKTRTS